MNDETKNYVNAVRGALNVSSDSTLQADAIVGIPIPDTSKLRLNTRVLAHFIQDLKFDWQEFDDGDEAEFTSRAVKKIEQISTDITENNHYHTVFRAETAYGKIADNQWLHEISTENMTAKTIEEANLEIDRIRLKASKTHPTKSDFTLDFVRVKYDILDQSNKIVTEDELIPEEE